MFRPVFKPNAGGDGSTPGPAGKSAYQLAVQQGFEGTLEDWLASLQGPDGKSVELQKSETAIQWRKDGGQFADLVTLEEIKGAPGDAGAVINDHATAGYIDIGDMRMAWGSSDFVSATEQTYDFPAEFSVPPVVQITRRSRGPALSAKAVSTVGFTLDRGELRGNPVPFLWAANGIRPGATVAPNNQFEIPGLPTWSAAVRAQRSGMRPARVLCLGDSTTAGFGAYATSAVTNDKAGSYPTQLAQILAARGTPASWANWIGNGNTPQFNTYDHRVAFTTGWGLSNADTPLSVGHTLGGFALRTGVTQGQGKLTFDTISAVDTVEVYFLMRAPAVASSFVGFTVDVDGVDFGTYITSFDNDNPGGIIKVTVPTALGRRTIGIRSYATTDRVYCLGMIGYDSSAKEASVVNCGWGTSRAADWNNSHNRAWSPLKSLERLDPDLCILNLGINDSIQDSPAIAAQRVQKEAYMRDMQAIIDACRSSGSDVLLVVPNQIGNQYAGYLDRFVPFIQELASRNGLPLVDIQGVLGSTWEIANAAGYMRDSAHPNAAGYEVIAEAIADVIMPVTAQAP